MTKLLCTLSLFAGLFVGISECAAQWQIFQLLPFAAQGAQAIGDAKSQVSNDADMSILQLTMPTAPDLFVENARAAAKELGYEVTSVNGQGAIRVVVATKRDMDTGIVFRFSRRDMTYITVTLQLGQDGRTVQVSSQNMSNTGAGEPGAAKKVIEEFKGVLQKLYASNATKSQFAAINAPPSDGNSAASQVTPVSTSSPSVGVGPTTSQIAANNASRSDGNPAASQVTLVSSSPSSVGLAQQQVANDPNSAEAWLALGKAYTDAKQFLEAERSFGEAVRLQPDSLDALYELGRMASLNGDQPKVRKLYQQISLKDENRGGQFFNEFLLPK